GLSESERVRLETWEEAVRKIGKGTGKHAARWRQRAREAMQGCRSAIPAWIMPIFKVAEAVDMAPEAFDVAIVDEASQSGPEALFLQYLARKVIVVGDDQQISPDNVGVDRDKVQFQRVEGGVYDDGQVNEPEARSVVEQLLACLADPAYAGKTFGVVSLVGSEQARLIGRLLAQRVDPAEMERRKLLCGDAYAFQ